MAPPPLLPDIFKVVFSWSLGTHQAVITMHFDASADESTLATQIGAAVTQPMWGSVCAAASIGTLAITRLDNLTASQEFPQTGTKWQGASAGTDFDPAVSVLVSFKTAFRGLGSHARVYLPFTDSALTTAGILGSGTEASMQTAWAAFRTSMNSAGSPLQSTSYGVFHVSDPGPPIVWVQDKAPVSHPVTTVNVKSALATQRRRQNRVQGSITTFLAAMAQGAGPKRKTG